MEFAIDAGAVAVTIGLTNAAKTMGLSGRYAPLVSITLGLLYAFSFPPLDVANDIMTGLIIGLSASGLYSGAKAVTTPQ